MPEEIQEFAYMLSRLQAIDEKIRYSEGQLRLAKAEGQDKNEIRRLEIRLNNLKKERSLYHAPMQKLKPLAGYRTFLYNKIEGLSPYNSSRYA